MSRPARILGAVLAGGRSLRFGSDKALAPLAGRALIDHVLGALWPQVQGMVVVGRTHGRFRAVPDRPTPGLGPLGGLCGALRHAETCGFDAVLSVGCDSPILPADLVSRLALGAPAYVEGHPLIGCWPAAHSGVLEAHLAAGGERSMRGWARRIGARPVVFNPIPNINHRGDLQALSPSEMAT